MVCAIIAKNRPASRAFWKGVDQPMKKIRSVGFLGFGNMAQAMAKGFVEQGALEGNQIFACARRWERLCDNTRTLGAVPCRDGAEVARNADLLVVAVKPYLVEEVLAPLGDLLKGKLLLSVAAGWSFQRFEEILPAGVHHLSTMPNTPVSVGEGVILLEQEHSLDPEEYVQVKELLSSLGMVEDVTPSQMGIGGTISGCGPAWAAMFLEALGDAGVMHGLPRELSYRLAAQMLLGTAKLHLITGEHPGAMKDAVCSPGGTTIQGVAELERQGFRGSVISAVDAVQRKGK